MRYRPEIDGLRAIAVTAVILSHAGIPWLKGGYVGVDVFFLISGYLITYIIWSDLEKNQFSLIKFYERRIRRILPPLILVCLVCLPLAWNFLTPDHLEFFSRSLLAISVFSSNILFWSESGYFNSASELKPLLHTWSLAVEEQYYLIFPLFVCCFWRFSKRWLIWSLIFAACGSLILAQWGAFRKPEATFFLLPTRGWELLIGGLVAIYLNKRPYNDWRRCYTEPLCLLGLFMILAGAFIYDEHTPFPSFYALIPTVGTALLLLLASNETVVGRMLSSRMFVGVGLISYSAYLWHQPVLVFARHAMPNGVSPVIIAILVIVSFVLGFFSWKYIERPFRDRVFWKTREVLMFVLVGFSIMIIFGIFGIVSHGNRDDPKWTGVRNAIVTQEQRSSGEKFCASNSISSPLGPLVCIIGDKTKSPTGVLWGDSLAGALVHGVNKSLESKGVAFYAVLSDGCNPIEGLSKIKFNCYQSRHSQFINEVVKLKNISVILWVGAVDEALSKGGGDALIDGLPLSPELVKAKMTSTLEKLKAAGKRVYVVGGIPRLEKPAAEYVISTFRKMGGDASLAVQSVDRVRLEKQFSVIPNLIAYANTGAIYINALDFLCSEERCSSHDQDRMLLFIDYSHVSHLGSEILAKAILGRIDFS